jgi:hypothetical protein
MTHAGIDLRVLRHFDNLSYFMQPSPPLAVSSAPSFGGRGYKDTFAELLGQEQQRQELCRNRLSLSDAPLGDRRYRRLLDHQGS